MINSGSIIIIDDDAESLSLAMVSLVTAGFAVKTFQDGAAGWAHMKNNSHEIDVIIVAKTLPNISGMELLHKIKENKSLSKIPVIIQTIDVEDGKATSAIEQGAQFYVHKPINPKQLIRLVRAAMRSRNGGGGDDVDSFVDRVKR